MLRVVVHPDVCAQRPLARVDGENARQDLEEGGLARPIDAHERHPLPPLDLEVDAVVDHGGTVRLVNAHQASHEPPRARRLRKGEADAPRPPPDLDALELVQHLDAALHLARLGRLVAEALHETLDLGHALGLVARPRLEEGLARLALDEEMIIVAHVEGDGAVRHLRDGGDHTVEEIPVVGDDDHAALVRREKSLQPLQRLDVEVVGRLVEEEEIGGEEEESGQGRPHAPASRELRE